MPAFLLKVVKGLAIHFATKYAAELLVKAAIEAMEKAAKRTSTVIDDEIVAKVKADRDTIISIVRGKG
ncbi:MULTISPECIES: hypothetical protein [unclassified Arsukibacterium]|uniref:hypothetical protein n=1 Tax=unclassified Arsukibacterium TaxID=2635278 RepID=UPI000C919C5B|nr:MULTISPECIES: hypothetical protein [unclassified Arsukibacterium]MAD75149.1 hypothetical protein [Rheinheimera sp.]MDX1538840.1 hypothetical protein [Arsukibacterium sp.]|tara:strand:- start:41579 stop:41782 length:204 start_codon:yes stop_codon:yes gene_type:complete